MLASAASRKLVGSYGVLWLTIALAFNWLCRSIFVDRLFQTHGMMPPVRLEAIVAFGGSVAFAWVLGLFGKQESRWQKIAVVVVSLAMPIILIILLLTVGCRLSPQLDVQSVCV